MYGKVMRNICPAKSKRSGSSIKPGANTYMSNGAKITPTMVISNKIKPRTPDTWLTRLFSSCSECFSLYSESTGTNAWEKAPSANKRRRKLGIRKATKKASVLPVAPKKMKITASRI